MRLTPLIISLLVIGLVKCDFIFDIEPPEVKIISPEEGSFISEKVEIVLQVDDNKNVEKVELYADDTLLTTLNSKPFSYQWQRIMDGSMHTIWAKAFDVAGNWRKTDSTIVKSLPTEVGYYDTPDYANDVYVCGSYAYVADDDDGLRIIKIRP